LVLVPAQRTSRRGRDYALGIVLPNLRQQPIDWNDAWLHFTEHEARELNLRSLPVCVQHANGENWRVGYTVDAAVRQLNAVALLCIETALGAEAFVASNSLAGGIYTALSLSHTSPEVRAGGLYVPGVTSRIAYELSLVEDPFREGADILAYFPCRDSLERMSDATFDIMCARYYPAIRLEPETGGKPSSARSRYIERLLPAIETALRQALERYRLSMSAATPKNADVRGSAEAQTQAQAPPATQQLPAASQQVPAQPQEPAGTAEPTRAPVIDFTNELAVRTHVTTVEEQMRAMREENARLSAIAAQATAREQEEQEKLKRKGMNALESLVQWLAQHHDAGTAAAVRAEYEERIRANPGSAISAIEAQRNIFVTADRRTAEAQAAMSRVQQEKAELEAKLELAERDRQFDALAKRRDAAYSAPLGAGGMNSRFAGSDVRASSSHQMQQYQPPAQQSAYQLDTATPSSAGEASAYTMGAPATAMEIVPAGADVRASSAMAARGGGGGMSALEAGVTMKPGKDEPEGAFYYRRAQAALHALGIQRTPTLDEVSYGLGLVAQPSSLSAGAGGKQSFTVSAQYTRDEPIRLGQQTLAPAFFQASYARMASLPGGMGGVIEPDRD